MVRNPVKPRPKPGNHLTPERVPPIFLSGKLIILKRTCTTHLDYQTMTTLCPTKLGFLQESHTGQRKWPMFEPARRKACLPKKTYNFGSCEKKTDTVWLSATHNELT